MNRPNDTVLNALYRYGLHVGMMTQVIDDCLDLKVDLAMKFGHCRSFVGHKRCTPGVSDYRSY